MLYVRKMVERVMRRDSNAYAIKCLRGLLTVSLSASVKWLMVACRVFSLLMFANGFHLLTGPFHLTNFPRKLLSLSSFQTLITQNY